MYDINKIRDTIICGSVLDELKQLPNECVDAVCCSPPYWGLRSYGTNPQVWGGSPDCSHEWGETNTKKVHAQRDHNEGDFGNTRGTEPFRNGAYKELEVGTTCTKCGAWRGELGLEPTFQLYIEHLLEIFDEVHRVLKKTGTCWVNLGDTYAGSGKGYGANDHGKLGKHANEFLPPPVDTEIPAKSLCNIPHRFAIGMTDHKWIQRNTIIWHKPSCMPSSAKDRFTVDFEYVFFFVKSKKYWFEQQFEPMSENTKSADKYIKGQHHKWDNPNVLTSSLTKNLNNHPFYNDKGRNRRAVWRINPQPFKMAHFAVFPEKLVEPMILAGCPPNGITLDPFVGSGTTCLVARKLGRHYIGIDLNSDYCDMARKRLVEVL